ncbi:MAG: methyltransferase domain-containing protein [Anaeromyxobacter sp.]|nr:methyltransferase domain-containing protein [Anaeromyxobacter sp.]MBL0275089.1 methyltransferase domain-containing protein [Anaeromyxobacter sp.]
MSGAAPLGEAELAAAGRALARWAGLSLGAGLEATLRRAVAAAAQELERSPAALAAAVAAGDHAATEVLAEHAVVGETSFWRHAEGLLALAHRLAGAAGPLSIWSAGCATGEEPYSLAVALLEAGRDVAGDTLLATDLSQRALARARAGLYRARALRRLPRALAGRWFQASDQGARVDPRAAAPVRFLRHNLLEPAPPGPFDAVVCRNVLIYFEAAVAAAALQRLAGALKPGGLLLLGPVELPLATGLGLALEEEGGATLLRRG